MSWKDVLSAFGVWLALVCASFGLSFREAVLPLFIGSNCAADNDSTSTHGDEQDPAEIDDPESYDPYTENLAQHAAQEAEERQGTCARMRGGWSCPPRWPAWRGPMPRKRRGHFRGRGGTRLKHARCGFELIGASALRG